VGIEHAGRQVAQLLVRCSGSRSIASSSSSGDCGDDVVGAPDAETLPALVEEQGGSVVGAGPVGALAEPASERGVQLRVDRDLPSRGSWRGGLPGARAACGAARDSPPAAAAGSALLLSSKAAEFPMRIRDRIYRPRERSRGCA
jgi:hypothetical protein